MGTRDTYQKTLLRACVLAGDETSLARRLGVPASTVIDWLLGDKPIPVETSLVAVDLALIKNKEHVIDVQKFLEEVRRRHGIKPPKL